MVRLAIKSPKTNVNPTMAAALTLGLVLLLTGCNQTFHAPEIARCKGVLSLAKTPADSALVLSMSPGGHAYSCAWYLDRSKP